MVDKTFVSTDQRMSSLPDLGGDGNKRDKDKTHLHAQIDTIPPGMVCMSCDIYIYILHASSLAGLGVHESSLREPMDATFWLKEMSQNSIHFVFT